MAGQFSTGTPPGLTITRPVPERRRFSRWVIAIVIIVITVMAILFGLIYQSSVIVSTKGFSYGESASQGSGFYTLQIANVNGAVTLASWGQDSFLINGTITAKGLGSSPSQVTISESNNAGTITFRAVFPNNAAFLISQTYSVKINVFVPISVDIGKLVVDNVNGLVQAKSLNVTGVSLSSENGDIDFTCSSCGSAGFSAQTTNGNIAGTFSSPITNGNYTMLSQNGNVNVNVPSSSSFKLTASLVSGTIQTPNLTLSSETRTTTQLTATIGAGGGNVILSTVVGDITVTGI